MIRQKINTDEKLDLVDNNDLEIGSAYRSDIYKSMKKNYRVVNAFVVNRNNEIFIPIRSHFKTLFPDALDFSIGGHVKKGETYIEAIIRECTEELNINLKEKDLNEILYLNPYNEDISSFMKIWVINYNKEIEYNKSDFKDANWICIEKLEEFIMDGVSIKDDLKKVIAIIRKRNLTIAST